MPYMLAPGARLVVGPHGQLDETLGALGACCAPCARGALGADALVSSRRDRRSTSATPQVRLVGMPTTRPELQAQQARQAAAVAAVAARAPDDAKTRDSRALPVDPATGAAVLTSAVPGASASPGFVPPGSGRKVIIAVGLAAAAGLGYYALTRRRRRR